MGTILLGTAIVNSIRFIVTFIKINTLHVNKFFYQNTKQRNTVVYIKQMYAFLLITKLKAM